MSASVLCACATCQMKRSDLLSRRRQVMRVGRSMGKSFKDYEHEGWNKKASQYERVTLPITRQGFEPILTSFGELTRKRLLDVCIGPGHLAGEAAARGALVDAVDFSEAMIKEAKARFNGIGFMEGDAKALPYNNLTFDAV